MRTRILTVMLLWSAQVLAWSAQELPRGSIIDEVICGGDTGQSYALYVPSGYSPDRPWPILYGFDPGARGLLPVERFKDAAEQYGFIVVGSNNSRNGPVEITENALNAMLADTRARFSLDPRRVYVTGFSGGARAAVLAGLSMQGQVAGVIGFGAGFPVPIEPSASLPFAYFSAAGTDDFNYPELRNLDLALERLGLPHRVDVFEGGHSWPPEIVCTRALEWMELQAMRSGRRNMDATLVEHMFAGAMTEAASEESAGQRFRAFSRYARSIRRG